ncbi:MAG: class I SAM-dependent methyltransferase [Candidatus Nitrosocaldus sp.]|nr:class I SAM-dependent methyltransferase [Candidatus Nitrosocaldus sp.]MDW8275459.1 class I SAM-dependent methyltransferase [Candidatus Nitrosocaldus sp.]
MHSGHRIAVRFFRHTSGTYDRVVRLTTFGRDGAWKRFMLGLIPHGDYTALDLACGTGILTIALRERVSTVYGLDLIHDSLVIADGKAKGLNYSDVMLMNAAAEFIPLRDCTVDVITASYLAKYCDIERVVRECRRVLRDGGVMVMHDFTYPGGVMRYLWHAYFALLRFIGVFVSEWRPAFNELDRVIVERRGWVDELMDALKRNGFRDIRCVNLTFNTAAVVYARKG